MVALIAAAAYMPAAWWGLPHATHRVTVRGWDVDGVAGINTLAEVHNLLVRSKPTWYVAYPLFHYLVVGAASAPYLLWLKLTGGLGATAGTYPYGFRDPVAALAGLALIGRLVTLAMAVGAVVLVYLAARAVWDRPTAVLGAMGYALATPVVYYARTSNLDIPVMFWTAAALYGAALVLTRGADWRRLTWLGLTAALAVATKDQAYGALVPVLLYVLYRLYRDAGARGPLTAGRATAVLVGVGAIAFVVASGIPLWPGRFVAHLRYIAGFEHHFFNVLHPSVLTILRPPTTTGRLLLLRDAGRAVLDSVGPVIFLAGLIGIGLSWWRTPAGRIFVLAALGLILLAVVPIRHMQYRYAILPAGVLAV
ncbi:MAG TPA: glycosyltransferase family 39 protein, partial [Gemmatimonadales bacterium]|nr:glycosyltransferase family 39 protein [Gemmatimonadales bacterium]